MSEQDDRKRMEQKSRTGRDVTSNIFSDQRRLDGAREVEMKTRMLLFMMSACSDKLIPLPRRPSPSPVSPPSVSNVSMTNPSGDICMTSSIIA